MCRLKFPMLLATGLAKVHHQCSRNPKPSAGIGYLGTTRRLEPSHTLTPRTQFCLRPTIKEENIYFFLFLPSFFFSLFPLSFTRLKNSKVGSSVQPSKCNPSNTSKLKKKMDCGILLAENFPNALFKSKTLNTRYPRQLFNLNIQHFIILAKVICSNAIILFYLLRTYLINSKDIKEK